MNRICLSIVGSCILLGWGWTSGQEPKPAADKATDKSTEKKATAGVPEAVPIRVLEGHEAEVYSIEYSPDGTKIATGSFDRTIKLWDSASNKEIASLGGHTAKILALAFTADSRSIISGSEDKTLKLWDVPGEGALAFTGVEGSVEALALSPDSSWLATGSTDGKVRIWNAASRKEALAIGAGGPVRSVAFSSDGRLLASGGGKAAAVWDVSTFTAPKVEAAAGSAEILKQGASWRYLKGTAEPPAEWKNRGFDDSKWAQGASGFGYSPEAEELATVGTRLEDMMGNYLSIYVRASFKVDDPKQVERLALRVLIDDGMVAYLNGEEVGRDNIEGSPPAFNAATMTSHEAMPVDIDLTPRLGRLVAGENVIAIQGHNQKADSSDFVLTPTLTGSFKKVEKEKPPAPKLDVARFECGGQALAVALSPDGTLLAAGGDDKLLHVWKIADGSERKLEGAGEVRGLAFIDGDQIAATGEGAAVRIWSISQGKAVKSLEGHQGNIRALAIRADRTQLLTGGDDKTVRLWDLAGAKEIKSFGGHGGAVTSVAFAGDSRTVVSGSEDKSLRAWNVESGKELRKFAHSQAVKAAAGGATDRYYAAAGEGEVLEWRPVSVEAIKTFSGHGDFVHCVAFSPDGSKVASGSKDKTIRLWNRADGKEIRSINAHDSSVYCLAFNHDGGVLASGSYDRSAKLWNTADGALLKKLDGHGEGIFCLKFSKDGQFLYTGSSDRSIRKWNVGEGKEAARFEGHPGWISGIEFSPNETQLVSIDFGGHLFTWSAADAKPLSHRKVPTVVYDLAISPDGKHVATANLSGKAFILEVEAK